MKSVVHWNYDMDDFTENTEEDILNDIRYDIGDKVLLVGDIGSLGKKLRMRGVHVTILENGAYQDVCYSLILNENCSIVKGSLELLPFEDDSFDKVIILDHLNYVNNHPKALKETQRVLKLKGKLILEDSNLNNIKIKLKSIKHKVLGERIKYYYPQEIMSIFSNLNFAGIFREIECGKYIYIGEKND
ncbi:MAG: class I SAM-dependent methyltransferase [Paraclostridium sp.]